MSRGVPQRDKGLLRRLARLELLKLCRDRGIDTPTPAANPEDDDRQMIHTPGYQQLLTWYRGTQGRSRAKSRRFVEQQIKILEARERLDADLAEAQAAAELETTQAADSE